MQNIYIKIFNFMKKTDLVEIKKGEYGTGLLIENDGYISMVESANNKKYMNQ